MSCSLSPLVPFSTHHSQTLGTQQPLEKFNEWKIQLANISQVERVSQGPKHWDGRSTPVPASGTCEASDWFQPCAQIGGRVLPIIPEIPLSYHPGHLGLFLGGSRTLLGLFLLLSRTTPAQHSICSFIQLFDKYFLSTRHCLGTLGTLTENKQWWFPFSR